MNTETPDHGFHARLAQLIGAEEPFAWAKRAGIPSSTFSRFWNERTIPKSEHLCRIADYSGVSLDWLVRGLEPMRLGDRTMSPAAPLVGADTAGPVADKRLIGRLTEKIAQIYKEMGVAIALHQVAERATEEHNRIVTTVADPIERLVEVGAVGERLRQELLTAATDSGSSKRRA